MRFLGLFLAIKLFAVGIVSVDKNIAKIDGDIEKGVSGVVVCPYNGNSIIAANAVSLGDGKVKLSNYDYLKNRAFALPIVPVTQKCEAVFKRNYNRILILAPTQKLYLKLKEEYKNSVIVPVDNFALFFEKDLTKKDILNFAKIMNVGRIIVAKKYLYEVDANSLQVVSKKEYLGSDKNEFFTNYGIFKIDYKKLIKGVNG